MLHHSYVTISRLLGIKDLVRSFATVQVIARMKSLVRDLQNAAPCPHFLVLVVRMCVFIIGISLNDCVHVIIAGYIYTGDASWQFL